MALDVRSTHENRLHSLLFELRFDTSYMIWDRSGVIARAIKEAFPEFEASEASPARVLGSIPPDTTVLWEANKLQVGVATLEELSLTRFKKVSAQVVPLILEELKIDAISRTGLRAQYVIGLEPSKAMNVFREKFLASSRDSVRIDDEEWELTSSSIRLHYKNDHVSCVARIEPAGFGLDTQKLAELPPEFLAEDLPPSNNGIMIDVDCYTTGTYPRTGLDTTKLIETQNFRIRDCIESVYGESKDYPI